MTTLNSSTKLKFKRSKTAGKRPDINSIEPGELFVNLADKSIHTSDGTNVIELGSKLTDNYLPLKGGTLTGPVTAPKVLVSQGQATEANSLTRKDYVDKSIDALNKSTIELANTKVNKAGDIMTGNLTVPKVLLSTAQGTEGNAVVRKDYADTKLPLAGGTITGPLNVTDKLNMMNKELIAGQILLADTANKRARTYISQWTAADSTAHRFEIYARSMLDDTRKNIMTADIDNAGTAQSKLKVTFAGDVNADSDIRSNTAFMVGAGTNGGLQVGNGDGATFTTCNVDLSSWYGIGIGAHYSGTYQRNMVINARTGDITTKGNITASGVFKTDRAQDGSGNALTRKDYVDTKFPLSGGNLTGGLNLTAGDYAISGDRRRHIRFQHANGTVDGYIYKDKGGDGIHINNSSDGTGDVVITNNGSLGTAGTVVAGTGVYTDFINKKNGSQFIAADGNINLPNNTNGFSAGWLLQQINSRINDAVNKANNAQTAANNAGNKVNTAVTGVRQGAAVGNQLGAAANDQNSGSYLTAAWSTSGGTYVTYRVLQVLINGTWRNIGR
ncbi:tail fiber protein [Kluyvera intermedia]|uniref:tail fiber protein n=1 Tax=Kluyvera intermedia TaxID=61648 RepID=UPI0034A2BEB2